MKTWEMSSSFDPLLTEINSSIVHNQSSSLLWAKVFAGLVAWPEEALTRPNQALQVTMKAQLALAHPRILAFALTLETKLISHFLSYFPFLSPSFHKALLDLPVQPSTEVLGFGQPSVASSLPFRFYDQSRRGPAFASVDKVPGKCLND